LDIKAITKNAIEAGVLAYANNLVVSPNTTNALTQNMDIKQYAKNAILKGSVEGVKSKIRGDKFKDGFKTGAVVSIVTDGALQMRKYVKDNFDYVGKNGEKLPDSVKSVGANGDGVKLAGSHDVKIGKYDKKIIAPFGGSQTGDRKIFGIDYNKGGAVDRVNEAFAGPHDFLSSWNYENIDGKTFLKNDSWYVEVASGLLLIPSVPLAIAPTIQNNLDFIQDYKHTVKENKKEIKTFMDEYNNQQQIIKKDLFNEIK
jgi:filamentous hemagglutinin